MISYWSIFLFLNTWAAVSNFRRKSWGWFTFDVFAIVICIQGGLKNWSFNFKWLYIGLVIMSLFYIAQALTLFKEDVIKRNISLVVYGLIASIATYQLLHLSA
jgi:hypothetical protein